MSLSAVDIRELYEKSIPMTHGVATIDGPDGPCERSLDKSIRHSRQVPSNLVNRPRVDLSQIIEEFEVRYDIKVKTQFNKMIIYGENGHFKKHCDSATTPFGTPRHAVLSLYLTVGYCGGDLKVYGDHITKPIENGLYKATIIPVGVEHEIEPVTHGYRVVWIYDLKDMKETLKNMRVATYQTYESRERQTLTNEKNFRRGSDKILYD